MARKIKIDIYTVDNYVRVSDYDDSTGEINVDINAVQGFGWRYVREDAALALTNANALIAIRNGEKSTGFFKFADIASVNIDGVAQVVANLSAVITAIAPYIFKA